MATYCVSDIHGQYGAFLELLNKINFRFNGQDDLIIMGDMIDWGEDSIKTLLMCKELDDRYPFVTVLIGNHEKMMLDYLNSTNTRKLNQEFYLSGWCANSGTVTFKEYLKLDDSTKREVRKWLSGLRYFVDDLEVGDNTFYVTHSSPYILGRNIAGIYRDEYEMMVWERVNKYNNWMESHFKDNKKILVYGHTITSSYGSIDENGQCKIYFDLKKQKIGIDCGAKLLSETKNRLSALRLDDFMEYYVDIDELAYYSSNNKKI